MKSGGLLLDSEKQLVMELWEKKISKDQFLEVFTVDVTQKPGYVKKLLEEAYLHHDADDVDLTLSIGFSFELFNDDFLEILCKLIRSSWHYQHENIAIILQRLKSPYSIEYLYQTALTQFEYLDFDDAYALAVKCIWGLGDINTKESRQKLKLLSKSDNNIIRDNALYQLKRTAKLKFKIRRLFPI